MIRRLLINRSFSTGFLNDQQSAYPSFGSRNERQLRQLNSIVAKINALETELQKLSDTALQAKTTEFKQSIQDGKSLDKLLPEAFAVCREASRRVLGMRHYDVQLIGGMVLHLGKIAEMRTGEERPW